MPAGTWSGEQLSGSTVYPNASAPAPLNTSTLPVVTGSASDVSLATYVLSFPNSDTSTTDGYAGLYVLRLVSGNPNHHDQLRLGGHPDQQRRERPGRSSYRWHVIG